MRFTLFVSLILILQLTILTGCPYRCDGEKDVINNPPPSEANKNFLPYKLGDVVAFSDSMGNQDVYTCTFQGMRLHTRTNKYYEDGDLCIEEYRTPQYATVLSTADSLKKIDLYVRSSLGNAFLAGKDNDFTTIYIDDTCHAVVECLDSLKVKNKTYHHVIHLWDQAFYTVKDGIIQFTDKSGTVWEKHE